MSENYLVLPVRPVSVNYPVLPVPSSIGRRKYGTRTGTGEYGMSYLQYWYGSYGDDLCKTIGDPG